MSSTPLGAAFSWVDLDQNPTNSYPGFGTATRTDFITPGTNILRSGRYRVSASKPGFLPWEQTLELSTTNYYFYLTNISLPLASRIVKGPFAAPHLTNSLNAMFIEVGAKRPPWPGFPLYACATETTVAEFREFVKKTQRPNMTGMFGLTINGYAKTERTWEAPGWEQTDRHPVVGVNWDDATAFCKWLTEVDRSKGPLGPNQVYRLPSSEEWKKIAGEAKYPWGDSSFALDIVGNYCGTEVRSASVWPAQWPCIEGRNDGYPRTAPPDAKFKAGERGFYHMGGNAAEWCQDKVLCGGSWFDGEDGNYGHRIEEYLARETVLKPASPERRDDRYGFRVVIAEE